MTGEAAGQGLHRGTRSLIVSTTVFAVVLAAGVVVLDPLAPSWTAIAGLAVVVAAGEALRVDLSFRRGGVARFTLVDAVMTGALLLASPTTVLTAMVLGMLVWQLAERQRLMKLAFNVAQYTAAVAAAALTVRLVAPGPHDLSPRTVAGVALGVAVFTLLNTTLVSAIIGVSSGRRFLPTWHRMLTAATLIAAGNGCLGFLAVVLWTGHAWALPALAMPVAVLYAASRQEVRAQLDRERSQSFVAMEHRLAEAGDPESVRQILAESIAGILECHAAVWVDGSWMGTVPEGSTHCSVEPTLTVPLMAKGAALGPAVSGACGAIGLGDAVLVIWAAENLLDPASEDWLGRVGTSGRVHTVRSRATADLGQERATLRAIVDGTVDGIFLMDSAGVVQLCNPAMEVLAQTSGDVAGHHASELFGEGPWTEEGVHDVVRPGDRVWRVSLSAIRDGAHRDLRVAVVHDVTAERRVARMKDDMLSIVSHELRTPLTPIKGSAQLLRRRWERMPVEQREEMLRHIEQRADHLTRLVEDLLLVGQLSSSGRAHPRIVPADVDLVEVARDGIEHLDNLHRGHHIELTAPDRLRLTADPLRVRQILENLVNNACKFSPQDTPVAVSLVVEGDWALLRVTDQGRGIPPEDVERVFERFERVEDPLHMTTSGAGLGLYIVRSLAQGMGGDVHLSSVLGAGTTVTIRLPLSEAGRNTTRTEAPASAVA